MAFKYVLKLSSIDAFIDDNKIIKKKGENALESSHVKKMDFYSDFQIIRGEIFASMKDKSYKVSMTANNFGAIIAACRRNRFPVSLFKTFLGEYNLDGIKAIQWGRTHEKDALDHLTQVYDLNIQPTGVWLTNSGLVGASPDGIIDEEAIVKETAHIHLEMISCQKN